VMFDLFRKCTYCSKSNCNCKKDVDTLVQMGFSMEQATTAYLANTNNIERTVAYLASLPSSNPPPDKNKTLKPKPNNNNNPTDQQRKASIGSSMQNPIKENDMNAMEISENQPKKENNNNEQMEVDQNISQGSAPRKSSNGMPAKRSVKRPVFDLDINKGLMCDVRDNVGKWVAGEIIERSGDIVTVNFLGWDSKWNEDIDFRKYPWRFAPMQKYSEKNENVPSSYQLHDKVWVCPLIPDEFPEQWVVGYIKQADGKQVQVEWISPRKFQRWFHTDTEEIHPYDYFQPPTNPSSSSSSSTRISTIDEATFQKDWFVGRIIEVLDTIGKWEPAEILKTEKPRIYITYMNWSRKWNEWLNVEDDFNSSRIRFLGAALKPGEEEKKKERRRGYFTF